MGNCFSKPSSEGVHVQAPAATSPPVQALVQVSEREQPVEPPVTQNSRDDQPHHAAADQDDSTAHTPHDAIPPQSRQSTKLPATESSSASPSSSPVPVMLCRFEFGKLVKEALPLHSTEFLALSHVWGDTEWQRVEGIEDEVLVSNEKAKFLKERLPSLVGGQWFWMDILSINQRNADERVAVTQHIPSIFRFAQKTIAIREGSGFKECCVEAAESAFRFFGKSRFARSAEDDSSGVDFDDRPDGRTLLHEHLRKRHNDELIDEGLLSRLWPLQEIMLSDTVQFVRCDAIAKNLQSPPTVARGVRLRLMFGQSSLAQGLSTLAITWSTHGQDFDDYTWHRMGFEKDAFVSAFLTLGTASRHSTNKAPVHAPKARDLLMHMSSTRQTSKPRDFILAIMPQYGFYAIPRDVRNLSFSQLFLDCARQLRGLDNGLAPMLGDFDHVLDGKIGDLKTTIPEPTCLGDLAKLFNGPVLRTPERSMVDLQIVEAKPMVDVMSHVPGMLSGREVTVEGEDMPFLYTTVIIHTVVRSMFNSKVFWLSSYHELDLELAALSPEQDNRSRALLALGKLRAKIDFTQDSYKTACALTHDAVVHELLYPVPWETTILYAAMISCGLGVSAFEWGRENLVPLRVDVNQVSYLGLAPQFAVRPNTMYFLSRAGDFMLGRDGPMPRFSLLAGNVDDEGYFTLCMFPPDTLLKASRHY